MFKYGEIYLMKNTVTGLPYVGSTINKIAGRMNTHLNFARNNKKSKLYTAMREHTFTIELLELFQYEHKNELRHREDHYISLHDSINNGYNSNRAFISADQRVERDRGYHKKHRIVNKFKIRKKQAEKIQCTTCGTYGSRSANFIHKRTAMHARLNVD
jgi:ribosomal protein L44E